MSLCIWIEVGSGHGVGLSDGICIGSAVCVRAHARMAIRLLVIDQRAHSRSNTNVFVQMSQQVTSDGAPSQ